MRLRPLIPFAAAAALFAGSAAAGDRPGATASQAGGPRVFGAFEDSRRFMSATGLNAADASQLSLSLPAGSYVIQAKATIVSARDSAHCRLSAGTDFDETNLDQPPREGRQVRSAPLALTVLHSSSSSFLATLRCADNGSGGPLGQTEDKKITAVQVGQISNRRG